MQSSGWRYTGKAEQNRLEALENSLPNAQLGEALRKNLKLECFHREPAGNREYKRAVFCGSVGPQLFDWFFNASTGYRGSYFKSASEGVEANRVLINQLTPFLVEWVVAQQLDPDRQWVLSSLAQPSAKAWLAEHPGLCAKCGGEWHASSSAELQIENSRWECSAHTLSAWGRQAPQLSKIRIFGGFIDFQHHEWLAHNKTRRATDIWEYGWS